jgi:endonuclease/exonuclease/phosphatase family metal-dependent hydrolase
LRSANAEGLHSFPARRPRIELDYVLDSAGIEINGFRKP